MTNTQKVLEAEVLKGLSKLIRKDGVTELRILNTSQGTISGYFDDLAQLAKYAVNYNGKVPGIYITLNPVLPDLLARSANRITSRAKTTTSDNDINRRCWFPVDFDPIRPSGISSTNKEHEAAITMAKRVQKFLADRGWGEPIFADSGNGAHLLYAIDMPNDEESKYIVKSALEALDFHFSDGVVGVDTSTFNAARIWKLYGTLACKGDSTTERPHRLSNILSTPEEIKIVSTHQLKELVGTKPNIQSETKKANSKNLNEKDFNLDEFLVQSELDVASKGSWQKDATKVVLETCPWNNNHTDRSAYIIQFENGAIAAGCHHNSCKQQNWKTLRQKFDPDWEFPLTKKESPKESQADTLIRLGNQAEYFQDDLEEAYAAVEISTHREIIKIKSHKFKKWLTKQYYEETLRAPSVEAMNQAIGVMEMMATYGGVKHNLNLRVAEKENAFYYDLSNKDWAVVKITPNQNEILTKPPLLFTRNKNMRAQVTPNFQGDLKQILKHVQIKNPDDQLLYLVYLVTCLIPNIPHTVLAFSGEKGASKSTSLRMTRQIVDPAVQELLTMPKSIQDLALSLANNYMPCFDNLDGITSAQSDLLCITSTGGGFSKRTLFTDDDETLLELLRCVGMTGINVVVTKPDLIDRSIIIELDRIPQNERKEERVIWDAFERDKASIIGGALRALSQAMEIYPTVQLKELPRMADFTRWGWAIAEALGYGGDKFIKAYTNNRSKANEEAIMSHPVAAAIIALMRDKIHWSGSVAELLKQLEYVSFSEKINIRVKSFPKAAHILSRRLKEVKSNLDELGITFEIRHTGDQKTVYLYKSSENNIQNSVDEMVSSEFNLTSSEFYDQLDF
ncbi:hypothetical protein ASG66_17030 [Bacillus sp. Leaf406]|nr:hypothetical protein ASG66_17030 [Bacillus sp. Leaf406]